MEIEQSRLETPLPLSRSRPTPYYAVGLEQDAPVVFDVTSGQSPAESGLDFFLPQERLAEISAGSGLSIRLLDPHPSRRAQTLQVAWEDRGAVNIAVYEGALGRVEPLRYVRIPPERYRTLYRGAALQGCLAFGLGLAALLVIAFLRRNDLPQGV